MKTIHHVVDIDAAPDRVWTAVTQPAGLAGWWSTKLEAQPPAVGAQIRFTFGGDFNPVMQITELDEGRQVDWRCVAGHDPWKDNTFRFGLSSSEGQRTRLRFWQYYAIELEDDYYGVYNFNWGYYLESLRLLCTTGAGTPFRPEPA